MNQLTLDPQPESLSYRTIPLTQGQVAIVDAEDYEELSRYTWCAAWRKTSHTFYAVRALPRNGSQHKSMLMHRQILTVPEDVEVDHKDRNGLNDRRENLRTATKSQNQSNSKKRTDNSSGVKGVSFNKNANKWSAYINLNGKKIHLGYFADLLNAKSARINTAVSLHGEFARQ